MTAETFRQPDPALVEALTAICGDRVTTARGIREQHGRDESYHPPAAPDVVVFAQSTEEVSAVVKVCAARDVPVIAYGTGTSLEGHVLAVKGGVCIDLSQMNKVLAVHAEDMDVTVQAGVTRKALNEYLRDTGLFFPIDPGADASLGGMAATRASGTNAVRYGTMRENVLSMTVVLADGRIIRTSRRARKSAAGYDLTRLFVGSEGTLGIITEVTLKLYGIPEAISAAVCPFPSLADAVNTVIQTIQIGVPVARIELLDEITMGAVNRYAKLSYPEQPTLFFEFHGTRQGVDEQAELVQAIAGEHGGTDFRWTTSAEERSKLWQARHDAYYASLALDPGKRAWTTDVCVPISKLADNILATKADIEASRLKGAIVGHVGDGNFHTVLLVDPDRPDDLAEAEAISQRMVGRALDSDGTCTGEHGVGYGKMKYLEPEHGADGVDVMRAVKRALDPRNLLNPGKMVKL